MTDLAEPYRPHDRVAVLAPVDGMAESARGPWTYEEPDSLDDIRDSANPMLAARVDSTRYADQVRAAWLGRIAGNLGKPVEFGSYWTVERIKDYLELAGAFISELAARTVRLAASTGEIPFRSRMAPVIRSCS